MLFSYQELLFYVLAIYLKGDRNVYDEKSDYCTDLA